MPRKQGVFLADCTCIGWLHVTVHDQGIEAYLGKVEDLEVRNSLPVTCLYLCTHLVLCTGEVKRVK